MEREFQTIFSSSSSHSLAPALDTEKINKLTNIVESVNKMLLQTNKIQKVNRVHLFLELIKWNN